MPTDIVAARPRPARDLARCVREQLARVAHLRLFGVCGDRVRVDDLALPACEAEAAVDKRRAEEPLRHGAPDGCHDQVAQEGAQAARGECWFQRGAEGGVRDDEEGEGEGCPDPADFYEVDVEDVAFACEVRGRDRGGVRLQGCAVGRIAGCGVED